MDYDELYQLMESVATDFEIPNPFPEKERFVDIYRTLQGFDELSWTDILEYGDDRSKFRVPESVVDEMEKISSMVFKKFSLQKRRSFHHS